MAITTTEFLASIKRNVTMPSSQIRFSTADILKMADEQMQVLMLPLITSLRSEFFVVQKDVAMVADQAQYKIPYRAVGRTLREIKMTNSDTTLVYRLPFVVPEDAHNYLYNNSTGDARAYTIRGDNVVVLPTPSSGTTQVMQMFYELAPSSLIEVSSAGVVASIASNVVTLEGAITGFATGDTMDLIDYQSGNSVIAIDIVNSLVSGAAITFTLADLPSAPNALKAGDYVVLSGQSPVLQIPNECVFVLIQAVCCKMLEAQGDFEGLQNAEKKLQQNIQSLEKIITPRVEADVPTILNNNGLLRNRRRNFLYRSNM